MRPLFLDAESKEQTTFVVKAIEFYEANVGKQKRQIPFEELRYGIGDDRLADGLQYAFDHIYITSPKGIASPVRRRPVETRLELFRFVGSNEEGFSKDRTGTLRAFLDTYQEGKLRDLETEEFDDYLWSDDPRSYILVKKSHARPEDVIRYYNFEVLDTILSNSRSMTFSTEGSDQMPKGTFAKRLVREAKQLGLIYEARVQGNAVHLDIYGPIELFGRATRFSWRLSTLFDRAQSLLRDASRWTIKVLVHMKRRDLPCILSSESLPDFRSDVRPDEPVKPIFDSKVESKFYNAMSRVRKFRIEREAEPIAIEGTLVIPDYVFERTDGVKWYLEIVGFWRPEYTAKKRAKLQELKKSGFTNLILLVDHDYVQYFMDIGFPTFTYRMKGERLEAPYGEIVNLVAS